MSTAAQTIAEWSSAISISDIPEDVLTDAKLHLLDTLGCGLAAHAGGVATEGRATMDELGGEPQATVIGTERRLPAANAAFANAMLCHGLDFDDTHAESVSHVSTVIGPAALAAAEQAGANGRDTLAAIVAGNEVVCRIGMAAPGAFHARGFHPTAICGVFGGVAAVGRITGADVATTTSALGIAGSFAGGLFAYLADGTPTKPMHPAWAAHGAHLASRLAAHGAIGPQTVLEGKFGLYHAFLAAEEGEIDIAGQLADLGNHAGVAGRHRVDHHYVGHIEYGFLVVDQIEGRCGLEPVVTHLHALRPEQAHVHEDRRGTRTAVVGEGDGAGSRGHAILRVGHEEDVGARLAGRTLEHQRACGRGVGDGLASEPAGVLSLFVVVHRGRSGGRVRAAPGRIGRGRRSGPLTGQSAGAGLGRSGGGQRAEEKGGEKAGIAHGSEVLVELGKEKLSGFSRARFGRDGGEKEFWKELDEERLCDIVFTY